MSSEEARVLSEIRERVVRLETKIDAMTDVRDTAEAARDTALEALQSTRSAHLRIDEIADNQRWLWRTLVGAIIAAVIAAVTNLQGG
ncbi:hemolysin XhlA family protein [Cohnella sp. LGH]|uniref:Hemolysin XhlA n=1 Tax=Cohnella phaseoli TaxID=456490 RepID=A0A3D9KFR7_9BACL|nr:MULTISPECIES: hemolysin XhlA family protein [Cohnella]QTH41721.1 hemolysin XhlA family protein [Cohnella sp. LGH]RED85315.1 hemolysin XhlA [Cohnella phaseoli]